MLKEMIDEKRDVFKNYEERYNDEAQRKLILSGDAKIGTSTKQKLIKVIKSDYCCDYVFMRGDCVSNANTGILIQNLFQLNSILELVKSKIYLNIEFDENDKAKGTCFSREDIDKALTNFKNINLLDSAANILNGNAKLTVLNKGIYSSSDLFDFLKVYDNLTVDEEKFNILITNQDVQLTKKYMNEDEIDYNDFSIATAQFCNFRKFNRVFAVNSTKNIKVNERILSLNTQGGDFTLLELDKDNFRVKNSLQIIRD